MTINKNTEGSKLIIALEGRLDTTTAPELEACIKDSLQDVKKLVLNLEKLEYISSAGLRILILAQKMMNQQGTMVVTGANSIVMEVFEVTGFTDILTLA